MEYKSLKYTLDGGVARIVLACPAEANRVDDRLLRELDDAGERVRDEDSAIVLLITAEGDDFCAGWDDETRRRLVARGPEASSHDNDPFGCIAGLAIPTIAAIRGRAESAGLELALCCDLRIASSIARFALPEVGGGLLPLAGGTQRLPRLVGRVTALSMLIAGETLDAEAAYASGLVSRIVADVDLEAEADTLVRLIASRGPVALRYAKEAVYSGSEMTLDKGLRLEADLSVLLQATQDRATGVDAFLSKREPHFEGR